ncbi:hypothetical protein GGI01_000103 [Coemansia sp. RSA 376]|nr:hypothetical protein GGI14_000006 [Coemansia sp. S680]KAJ2035513.1 hypothetical protein H4S03_004265 [Coemansia sp. S3946]KAJ2073222.1 hypothetical protein GGH13_002151 [Coemansia sp. S155-1]KAJ2110547.1 hypothetical protein IW146_005858 [Coemansia sp. RSA 922]KAJ2264256.1 hypothetical protein GGI01_000103 [Coemansia sp. RSA 376]KAJ2353472.1 hypothetical protein GGH92_000636 [Coemansia sp. RSA 2673]
MNHNNEGYSHGYGGNQQQQGYNNQQQGYGYNQQQEQNYNNQYQQQGYQGQQQQGYYDQQQDYHGQQQQGYNQPPGYEYNQQEYNQGGRPDEHYGYPAEKQDHEYYGEDGDEGEDGDRGLKDKFVKTYVDQYGEEHSKINKATVGLAAVAVLGGAFLAKKYVDKKKNEDNMLRNQEIGGGGNPNMYDMGGKQHGGGYPSNATMGPYGGGP